MEPFKVVYKYKNIESTIHYIVLCFIGNKAPPKVMKILNRIKSLTLLDALLALSSADNKNLIDYFGENWYKYFYVTAHVELTIDKIKMNKKIIGKSALDQTWLKNCFIEPSTVFVPPVSYAQHVAFGQDAFSLRDDPNLNSGNMATSANLGDEYDGMDNVFDMEDQGQLYGGSSDKGSKKTFTTQKDKVTAYWKYIDRKIRPRKRENIVYNSSQTGGDAMPVTEDITVMDTDEMFTNVDEMALIKTDEAEEVAENDAFNSVEMNFSLDKLVDSSRNTKALDNQIMKITDTNIFDENSKNNWLKNADSGANAQVTTKIEDTYEKIYITTDVISWDDTINTIKMKIASVLNIDHRFPDLKIVPSRMYLWSEYNMNEQKEKDKITLGHKWIHKTYLFETPVEPFDDIEQYINLTNDTLDRLYRKLSKNDVNLKFFNDLSQILYDYKDYVNNGELYMVDIYSQLNNTNMEALSKQQNMNLLHTFVRIYFPGCEDTDEYQLITKYIGDPTLNTMDAKNSQNTLTEIRRNLSMSNKLINFVNEFKQEPSLYEDIFNPLLMTHVVIHVALDLPKNLFILPLENIFETFRLNETYPFMYIKTDQIVRKVYKDNTREPTPDEIKSDAELLESWFESSRYGLSFKVVIDSDVKPLSVRLTENGRLEFHVQWKESRQISYDKLLTIFEHFRTLIAKINTDARLAIPLPPDYTFKFAFMNGSMRFSLMNMNKSLTNKKKKAIYIDHNILRSLASLFFPYVTIVVEPRRRKGKNSDDTKSKSGTYLRYGRVSGFENIGHLIDKRILYFIQVADASLSEIKQQIIKEFNLTSDEAQSRMDKVTNKFQKTTGKLRNYKKLSQIPKLSAPGRGIEIQGQDPENYIVKIEGCKTYYEMQQIVDFCKVMIYLYYAIYVIKDTMLKKREKELRNLKNVAVSLHQVHEIIHEEKELNPNNVKNLKLSDPTRLNSKTAKGEGQYSRECQKNRQPQNTIKNTDELIALGYTLNPESGLYEKITVDSKTGKKYEQFALKLDDSNDDHVVYYVCDIDINRDERGNVYAYPSILTKIPGCKPCCNIKNQLKSNDPVRRNRLKSCSGQVIDDDVADSNSNTNLYIRQYSNKIRHDRIYILPEILDTLFNNVNGKTIVKTNKFESAPNGYYVLKGLVTPNNKFLTSLANSFELTLSQLRQKLIKRLNEDTDDRLFASLNKGMIKMEFKTRARFQKMIRSSLSIQILEQSNPNLEYDYYTDLVSQVFKVNIFVFVKSDRINSNGNIEFIIKCQQFYDPEHKYLCYVQDEDDFYPIIMVTKSKKSKDIGFKFIYESNDTDLKHLTNYYETNCNMQTITNTTFHTQYFVQQGWDIDMQLYDSTNRTRILRMKDGTLMPIKPSTVDIRYPVAQLPDILTTVSDSGDIIATPDSTHVESNDMISQYAIPSFDVAISTILQYMKLDTPRIHIDGFEYNNKYITSIRFKYIDSAYITGTYMTYMDIVPLPKSLDGVKELIKGTMDKIGKLKLKFKHNDIKIKQNYIESSDSKPKSLSHDQNSDTNDINISSNSHKNKTLTHTQMIIQLNYAKFKEETYQLLRYELSWYLERNPLLKRRIERVLYLPTPKPNKRGNKKSVSIEDRYKYILRMIRGICDRTSDSEVAKSAPKLTSIEETSSEMKWISENQENLLYYQLNNSRTLCSQKGSSNGKSLHCYRNLLYIIRPWLDEFVVRITRDIVNNTTYGKEIMRNDRFYVSEVVDTHNFTTRDNEIIVKGENINLNAVFEELYGQGAYTVADDSNMNWKQYIDAISVKDYELFEYPEFFTQKVLTSQDSHYRAFINGYTIQNILKAEHDCGRKPSIDKIKRVIKLHSFNADKVVLQTNIKDFFKAITIDWIRDRYIYGSHSIPPSIFNRNIKLADLITIHKSVLCQSTWLLELFALHKLSKIPICIFNYKEEPIIVFDKGKLLKSPSKANNNKGNNNKGNNKKETNILESIDLVHSISMKVMFSSHNNFPSEFTSIYFYDK